MIVPNGKTCAQCSGPLSGRQTKFDSPACMNRFSRNAYLIKTYGITVEQFDQLLEFQGGHCYICEQPPKGKRIMVVDHEHSAGKAGKVRGILCLICNLKFLGREKSSFKYQNAAEYLDDPPAVRLFGEIIAPGGPPKKRKRRAPRKK